MTSSPSRGRQRAVRTSRSRRVKSGREVKSVRATHPNRRPYQTVRKVSPQLSPLWPFRLAARAISVVRIEFEAGEETDMTTTVAQKTNVTQLQPVIDSG